MDYYIWSDIHNNDINVVVQLHTTNNVIIRSRQNFCWYKVRLNELLEISTFVYRNIGGQVSKYWDRIYRTQEQNRKMDCK